MIRWALVAAIVTVTACCNSAAPAAELPVAGERWIPPDTLWARIETCSGLKRPDFAVEWILVPGDSLAEFSHLAAPGGQVWDYVYPDARRVLLAKNRVTPPAYGPATVAHAMLHVVLAARLNVPVSQHSRTFFAKKCGPWVLPPDESKYVD